MTKQQPTAYEDSLKYYRDVKNSLDTAKEEGIEIGKELGREEGIEIATIKGIQKALQRGKLTIEEIAEDFDVSVEFVLKIKNREME